jgi:signal transduction histidine kinase
LDPLLELIFTQTSRVLGVNNFGITLYDKIKKTLRYAFHVENDERIYTDDEWPLEEGGLLAEIVRDGQPIVVDDYVTECSRRGIPPGDKGHRAWMGVPLSADDQVMGVMNVSSPEPGLRYSTDQLGLFSAIAVQAAAIINKGRLDEEMAQRARQLTILNQVSSAINSTLDLQQVLQLITERAAEILDAESGSLWLTDESTEALVFQIAVGPSSENLVGLRVDPGTGIVGATAASGEPIIVNDIQKDERHLSGPAESIDFTPRAIISVPLIYQEHTVGVLQILNKRDGSPFDEQDTQLMLAFAAQAAVALENARLFTMTDQALADRVEELSMFQKIDRALNATLDYAKVMELTLDWAMQETGAEVGVVTALNEERGGLFIVASRGFPPEYDRYRENPWLVTEGVVGRAVRTSEPVVVDDVAADVDYVMAVPETQSQLAVPFCLGNDVIGAISLESPELAGFSEQDVQFAVRLAERAVVPIKNAQLYDQVTRANDAKSQVISMVAHELKNPLTSIGGYARLLELSGGPMDETKRNFTRTIIANVDRMRTTVDDLLDISRVERGLLKLELEEVSMATVIGETLDSLRNTIEEKGLALELDIPDGLPLVWGDRTRLVQVLINLVDNARKYTPEGAIFIAAKEVELPIPDNGYLGRFVRCSVRDTGIGITKEDQERLFKSQFTRFDNARDVAKGYGLGLWLVNRLVQMQGGEIIVESEIGQGSTFALTVPVADGHAAG